MNAEIVAVGAELLLGRRIETNSHTIQKALKHVGVRVRFGSVVTDRIDDVVAVLRAAIERSDLVIVTGGLGPTADDVTRAAIARAADVPLEENAEAWRQIQEFFTRLQRPMPESNRLQALMPRGAIVLKNDRGTAPGVMLATRGRHVFAMPGVPAEMQVMLEQELVPRIGRLVAQPALVERTLHLFGLPEAAAGEKIRHLMEAPPPTEVAITVHDGVISIAICGPAESRARVLEIAAEVRALFGSMIFGEDEDRLDQVVGRRLISTGTTIATAESCTGGMLAAQLTRVPGISAVFLEGAVTYSNAAKERALLLPAGLIEQHGAVSAEVAGAMASGIARVARADLGVGITGVAGPDGGTAEKPVGLVFVALALRGQLRVHELRLTGGRDAVRLRATQNALNLIRLALLERQSA
ncbi:MAG: competence/damage-inducible protein A [Planctomycetota bacterium]